MKRLFFSFILIICLSLGVGTYVTAASGSVVETLDMGENHK